MKKVLSILTAVCIILSCTVTAFAQEASKSETVYEQIEGAVEYLTDGVTSYGVDDAVDYYTLVHSGVDMSAYNDAFLADVLSNLQSNNGKIVSSYGESLATYAAVILILSELSEDPYDFNGYDIVSAFEAMDPTTSTHPYYYRLVIPATVYCTDDSFVTAVCDNFISTYYVTGKGMSYYGYYSSDNTAYFITALSTYADEYADVMEDAFSVLETYKTDGGYFSDSTYSTEANTDSTALALMAYASVIWYVDDDNIDDYFTKIDEIYDELCAFEGSDTGIFISTYTGDNDAYATKEALMALEEYYFVAFIEELYYDEEDSTTAATTTTTTASNGETTTADTETTTATAKTNTSTTSPDTGANTGAVAFSITAAGLALVAFAKKKHN